MPRQILVAPANPERFSALDGPLVYLNGPIQGSFDWQAEAIQALGDLAPDLHVASPRARSFSGGVDKHLVWEQAAIERAARDGVILFWLSRETSHRCNRAFAANVRFELGEWAVKATAGFARVIVGFEKGFTGGPYLQRRLTLSYPNVPICRTLRQACAAAAELARGETPIVIYPRTLAELFVPSFRPRNNG